MMPLEGAMSVTEKGYLLLSETVHVLQRLLGPSLFYFQTFCHRLTHRKVKKK